MAPLCVKTQQERVLRFAVGKWLATTVQTLADQSVSPPLTLDSPYSWERFMEAARTFARSAAASYSREGAPFSTRGSTLLRFVYDEPSGELMGAPYDSGQTEVEPEILAELVASLRPVGDVDTRAQMTQGNEVSLVLTHALVLSGPEIFFTRRLQS